MKSDFRGLFRSYLWQAKRYVVFRGSQSRTYDSTSGVPQGSVSGPYLFVLYMMGVSDRVRFSHCLLYGNDIKMLKAINCSDAM